MNRAGWAAMGLLLALGLATSGRAQTAPRFHTVEINDDALTVIDLASIERRGEHAIAWLVIVMPKAEAFRYLESRTEFDCAGRRLRRIAQRIHGDDHRLIDEDQEVGDWKPIVDPSIAKDLLLAACDPDKTEAPALASPDVPALVDRYLSLRLELMSERPNPH